MENEEKKLENEEKSWKMKKNPILLPSEEK